MAEAELSSGFKNLSLTPTVSPPLTCDDLQELKELFNEKFKTHYRVRTPTLRRHTEEKFGHYKEIMELFDNYTDTQFFDVGNESHLLRDLDEEKDAKGVEQVAQFLGNMLEGSLIPTEKVGVVFSVYGNRDPEEARKQKEEFEDCLEKSEYRVPSIITKNKPNGCATKASFEEFVEYMEKNKKSFTGLFIMIIAHQHTQKEDGEEEDYILFDDGSRFDPMKLQNIVSTIEFPRLIFINNCQMSPNNQNIDQIPFRMPSKLHHAVCYGAGHPAYIEEVMDKLFFDEDEDNFKKTPLITFINNIRLELKNGRPAGKDFPEVERTMVLYDASNLTKECMNGKYAGKLVAMPSNLSSNGRLKAVVQEQIYPTMVMMSRGAVGYNTTIEDILEQKQWFHAGDLVGKCDLIGNVENEKYPDNIFAAFYHDNIVHGIATNKGLTKKQEEVVEANFGAEPNSKLRPERPVDGGGAVDLNDIDSFLQCLKNPKEMDCPTESDIHNNFEKTTGKKLKKALTKLVKKKNVDVLNLAGQTLLFRCLLVNTDIGMNCRINKLLRAKHIPMIARQLLESANLDAEVEIGNGIRMTIRDFVTEIRGIEEERREKDGDAFMSMLNQDVLETIGL